MFIKNLAELKVGQYCPIYVNFRGTVIKYLLVIILLLLLLLLLL